MSQENLDLNGRNCSLCGVFKNWDQYDKKPTSANGYHSQCKKCVGVAKRKWWRKKNLRKKMYPEVLDFSNSDIEIQSAPITSRDKSDLERVFRQLIFHSITSKKEPTHD